MAMICVNGCKECDGCMACQDCGDEPTTSDYCCECGCEIGHNEPRYKDRLNDLLCEECLLMLHRI